MPRERAAWVNFRSFSEAQRVRFKGILKLDPELTDRYLELIEPHIPDYILGSTILAESPPESAETSRKVLGQVAFHSKRLWELLTNLDANGASLWLDKARYRIGTPSLDLGNLEDDLLLLAALSSGASGWKSERAAGRPVDYPNRRFFVTCFRHYVSVFGETPKYTKGTKFQNFLKAVSAETCIPEAALRGDLTSSITAAIAFPPRTS